MFRWNVPFNPLCQNIHAQPGSPTLRWYICISMNCLSLTLDEGGSAGQPHVPDLLLKLTTILSKREPHNIIFWGKPSLLLSSNWLTGNQITLHTDKKEKREKTSTLVPGNTIKTSCLFKPKEVFTARTVPSSSVNFHTLWRCLDTFLWRAYLCFTVQTHVWEGERQQGVISARRWTETEAGQNGTFYYQIKLYSTALNTPKVTTCDRNGSIQSLHLESHQSKAMVLSPCNLLHYTVLIFIISLLFFSVFSSQCSVDWLVTKQLSH